MTEPRLDKAILLKAFRWFQAEFRASILAPIEGQFPGYSLPNGIQEVVRHTEELVVQTNVWPVAPVTVSDFGQLVKSSPRHTLPLFKQIVLLYRRHRAAETETNTEKTFHAELTETLESEVKILDALVNTEWFKDIDPCRLPRLKDFLPVQVIEAAAVKQVQWKERHYHQKFPILQAPSLFLPDLAFFRAKCEDREAPLAVAYLDIDHFKQKFNSRYTETKVDRLVLPRFLQAVEAHVYNHGSAYQEGGDEIVILVPSFSRRLVIDFLDELRLKLASLEYQDIEEKTTVSIGLCIVEPGCPLTDRELRDRASLAKRFAKEQGKDRIATFKGPLLLEHELEVVRPVP